MDRCGVIEKDIVVSLVSSDIRQFQREVIDCIDDFYSHCDCRRSLDRDYILDVISKVHGLLKSILELINEEN